MSAINKHNTIKYQNKDNKIHIQRGGKKKEKAYSLLSNCSPRICHKSLKKFREIRGYDLAIFR